MSVENLSLYERVKVVPPEAQKKITGGRLNGMTNISPMWRIKVLTEEFGICGIGWKTEIVRTWMDQGNDGEIVVNVEINLFIKVGGEWSDAIPGIGGAKYIVKERAGLYTDDEAYKKAYTDALSVACKALGIGGAVYWTEDSGKYETGKKQIDAIREATSKIQTQASPAQKKPVAAQASTTPVYGPSMDVPQNTPLTRVQIIARLSNAAYIPPQDVQKWITAKFGPDQTIDSITDEQFAQLSAAMESRVRR